VSVLMTLSDLERRDAMGTIFRKISYRSTEFINHLFFCYL